MVETKRIVMAGGAGALFAVALAMLAHGSGTEGWSAAARWTARWSLVPFVFTFVASALLPMMRGAARELLRNRRGLGLAFALAHSIHLGAVVTFLTLSAERPPMTTIIGGGLAYLFILAMAVTSTDGMRHALGRWWGRLHRWGIRYIFLIFMVSYGSRLAAGGEQLAAGLYGMTLLTLALGIKLAARARQAWIAANLRI